MENKLIGTIMVMVVGVILLGSLLSVAISDYTTATLTYENEGSPFTLADAEDDTTHTLVLGKDATGNIVITLDGESCTVPDYTIYGSASVLIGESSFIRFSSNGLVTLFGNNGSQQYTNTDVGNWKIEDVTVSITGTTATIGTYTISNVLTYIAPDGDYRMTLNPKVNEDTMIIAGAQNVINGSNMGIVAYGDIDNLTTKAVFPSGRSVGDVNTSLDDYVTTLYTLNNINVECLNDGIEFGSMTINFVVAPHQITYDNPDYLGEQYVGLFGAIMVIFVAGLFVTVVGMIRLRD